MFYVVWIKKCKFNSNPINDLQYRGVQCKFDQNSPKITRRSTHNFVRKCKERIKQCYDAGDCYWGSSCDKRTRVDTVPLPYSLRERNL